MKTGNSHEATGNSEMAKLLGVTLCAMLFALCSPAAAQQAKKLPRIGLLRGTTPSFAAPFNEAFRQGLRELGYEEGTNILSEYRFAEGNPARTPDLVAELVRLKVDVIVAPGMNESLAARKATATIPIVTAIVADPVGAGLVASLLARPGGNVTGLTSMSAELGGKRLELLKEAFPRASPIALLFDPGQTGVVHALAELEAPAKALGVQLQPFEVRKPDDFGKAFEAMSKRRVGALFVIRGPVTNTNQPRIVELAARSRLPSMGSRVGFAEAGGLMFYGVNDADLFRRAAWYVERILKGTDPAELPVQQPTKFELIINLKTAKQIGLTIPPNVLARADRVIR
jgi:putative tryptophan/tyrosine transport system substrate-binding protein